MRILCIFLLLPFLTLSTHLQAQPKIELGVDVFFKEGLIEQLRSKRVGLLTNHTGVDRELCPTAQRFRTNSHGALLVALFAPEHGFKGAVYAAEKVSDARYQQSQIPIYSLYGSTRRPSEKMLKDIDVLVCDLQDIGCRPYTYASALFYLMEEAAKRGIEVIVLDRPNPMGGELVDGPMVQDKWRSYLGYVNVPYCHGMTIGELAAFFNAEYKVGCQLRVIPMRGWKRSMSWQETGLTWIPTSPQIPEADTPFFFASTGGIGALGIVNIGIGYTLPFKVVGAPWINGAEYAQKLSEQRLPGVVFVPFYYRPFMGPYKGEDCEGVLLTIKDRAQYRPLAVHAVLIGILKSLYPTKFAEAMGRLDSKKQTLFCQVAGNEETLQLLNKEKYITWKLIDFQKEQRQSFLARRQAYLIY